MRARETARERDGFCVCRSVCVYVCACVHAYVSVCVCVYVWSDSVCRVRLDKAPQNKLHQVPETLAELRRRGKRIFFVSNNASKHRSTYLSKFQKLGIEASVDDVVTSALGAAQVRLLCRSFAGL